MATKPQTIDEYLAGLSAENRAALQKVRRAVHAAAPGAEECISYGMPAFRLNGKLIAGFKAAANHCSFHPMSGDTVATLQADLAGYETSKGTIKFSARAARAALEEQLEEERKLWKQNPQRLREVLAEGSARAKIPSITPHVLRHTFGTRWLQAGGDIYKLSKILGHSSVAVTEAHYAHLLKEDLVAASQQVKIAVAPRGEGNVVRMPRRLAGTSQ